MSTYTEQLHPRAGDGKFATKAVSEASGGMSALEAAHLGEATRAAETILGRRAPHENPSAAAAAAQPALTGMSDRALGVRKLRPVANPLSVRYPQHLAAVADGVVDTLARTEGWQPCDPVPDSGTDFVPTDRAVRMTSRPEIVVQAAPSVTGSGPTTVAILDSSLPDPWRSAEYALVKPSPSEVDVVFADYSADGLLRENDRALSHRMFDPTAGPVSRRVGRCAEQIADMVDDEMR
ncbi:hypothetical protein [Isoptericola croceus]|uniref:hypothetical protein n=1 Tax=Isoptericola croceus TaxID=3031406 RepID=UPI0023F9C0D0|nr:hypothetical protein [Isoptericola croceus]